MRHFVAVAEELHFGKAALRLNMAQPPLSQSIRRLEVDLGVDLFDRSRRGVALTQAGRVFLQEARRTLMQADLARRMTCRAAEGAIEVRISFIGPALYRVLPKLLVRFRETNPGIAVRLLERPSTDQTKGVLAGDFDIGFVTSGTEYIEGCETLVMEKTGFIAAVPGHWPIAQAPAVSLRMLAEHPFILPPGRYAAQGADNLSVFKNIGLMPVVTQEATQTNTSLSLVGVGLGCSIVMATAALTGARNVTFIPVSDYPSHRRWELIAAFPSADLSGAACAFIKVVRAELAAHPEWLDVMAEITTDLLLN
jgi:DNA-binding transcriptional LysR family regulator